MTGREAAWNVDYLLGGNTREDMTQTEYAREIVEKLEGAHELAREALGKAAKSAQTWYNKRVKLAEFEPRQRVHVYIPRGFRNHCRKWESWYKNTGTVQKKFNDVTYLVWVPSLKRTGVYHVDKLRPVSTFE
jgi:hypothetical protein